MGGDEELTLKGEQSSILTKNIVFKVDRCDPKKSKCKSESEIEEFIHDLQIDLWVIYKVADFNSYSKDSTFLLMEPIAKTLTSPHNSL